MIVFEQFVVPKRLQNGQVTLYEMTVYDEAVPGMPWVRKTRKRVWPEAKQSNGRGKEFASPKEAIEFYMENREDEPLSGRQRHICEKFPCHPPTPPKRR